VILFLFMASPILYSVNPWFATDVTMRYRNGKFFAWVCECFDTRRAHPGTAASLIAPSSNPCRIYRDLLEDTTRQDDHSVLVKGYRKKFTRLANEWLSDGSLTKEGRDEILASVRGRTWLIWRPVLYVIPRHVVAGDGRLTTVARPDRAGYGPEMQVIDLDRSEFDIIELAITS
jgi:hypothetical protein